MLRYQKTNGYIINNRIPDLKTGKLEWHLLGLATFAPSVPSWGLVPYQNWKIHAPGTTQMSFQCDISYPLGSALHQPNVGEPAEGGDHPLLH